MRALLLASVSLIACLLSSCIDGKEEYWIQENGAVTCEATYELPLAAVNLAGGEAEIRRSVDGWLGQAPDVKREAFDITTSGDRTKIHIRVACPSATDLAQLSSAEKTKEMPATFRHLTGVFDVKLNGRNFELTRTISVNRALALVSLVGSKKDFEGRHLAYVVHLPVVATKTDAHRIEDGGKTLSWDFKLSDALKKPIVTSVSGQVPLPWWVYAALVAAVVLLAAVILVVVKAVNRRRRRKTTPTLIS